MKNILIIRLSAIGDVVFASPLIQALRRTYPEAKISWLVESAAAPLLRQNKALNEVIVWPKGEWKQLWRERKFLTLWRAYQRFKKEFRARQFDTVLDLQGLMKSAVWARASGAETRIGLGSKEKSEHMMTRVISRQGDSPRIGSEYYALAQELALDVADFEMDIALCAEDESFPSNTIKLKAYAVVCPFTTRPQKHWLEMRWPELIHRIQTEQQLPVVMLGGPADVAAAERIVAECDGVINLVGQSSLTQTAAVIKHSSLLVGVDTGLTHMGIAFSVPTVALFGSTCPYSETTRDNAVVLYHKMACSPCRRSPTCEGDFTCMKKITVDEVVETIERVRL